MAYLIDYDDPSTFPACLGEFTPQFEQYIRANINPSGIIENQLWDLHISEHPITQSFLAANMDAEIAVCHCTRILDEDSYRKNGITINGGKNSQEELRIRNLLKICGFQHEQIQELMSRIYLYWERDGAQRTSSVHFFADKSQAYKDDQINAFALNLGGEILRWSIYSLGEKKYREEPYKRLWILGTPSIIKFKCKLQDIRSHNRGKMISEIVEYNIINKLFGKSHEISLTGATIGNIAPKDIISIEIIENFIEIQEKYDEYKDFYNELK